MVKGDRRIVDRMAAGMSYEEAKDPEQYRKKKRQELENRAHHIQTRGLMNFGEGLKNKNALGVVTGLFQLHSSRKAKKNLRK